MKLTPREQFAQYKVLACFATIGMLVALKFTGKVMQVPLIVYKLACVPMSIVICWTLLKFLYKTIKYKSPKKAMIATIIVNQLDTAFSTQKLLNISTDDDDITLVPAIKVGFDDDLLIIYIGNSIKYQSQLIDLDLSANVHGYLQYGMAQLSHDKKWVIFKMADVSADNRLYIKDKSDLPTNMQIDKINKLPLTHYLIAGKTGSGKTYVIEYLIANYLSAFKGKLAIIDPKRSDLYQLPFAHADLDNAQELLDVFYQKMQKRKVKFDEAVSKKRKLNCDWQDLKWSPMLLIIDEFASFKAFYDTDTESRKIYKKMQSQLTQLVLQGRQLGVFVWIITQKPMADTLPTAIRSNLGVRLLLGDSDPTEQEVVFESRIKSPQQRLVGQGYLYIAKSGSAIVPVDCPTFECDVLQIFNDLAPRKHK